MTFNIDSMAALGVWMMFNIDSLLFVWTTLLSTHVWVTIKMTFLGIHVLVTMTLQLTLLGCLRREQLDPILSRTVTRQ